MCAATWEYQRDAACTNLTVAVALVGEVGYARMAVERVVGLAGILAERSTSASRIFDDCLLAAFEDALGRIAAVVVPAYEREREWPAKVAALAALLAIVEATSREHVRVRRGAWRGAEGLGVPDGGARAVEGPP